MNFLARLLLKTTAMPKVDPNDTWVIFDKVKRETARKPYEDIRLAINAEINARKAAKRAKIEAERQAAKMKEVVAALAKEAQAEHVAAVADAINNSWIYGCQFRLGPTDVSAATAAFVAERRWIGL